LSTFTDSCAEPKIEALKEQAGFIIFGEPKYFLVLRGAAKPKEEKGNHLKSHPGHKVRVWITGEESLSLPSASLYDKKSYLDSLMKIHA